MDICPLVFLIIVILIFKSKPTDMDKMNLLLGRSLLVFGFVVSGNCFMSMFNCQTKPLIDKYPNTARLLGLVTLYMYIVLILDRDKILTTQRVRVPLILLTYLVCVLSGKAITFWVVSFLVNALVEEMEYQNTETEQILTDEQNDMISMTQLALLLGGATIIVLGFMGDSKWKTQAERDAFPWASFAGGNVLCDGDQCFHH